VISPVLAWGLSPCGKYVTDTAANGFDFLTWQRQFGGGGGATLAAANSIPEPLSLLLAALGLLALSARRKHA